MESVGKEFLVPVVIHTDMTTMVKSLIKPPFIVLLLMMCIISAKTVKFVEY